MGGEKTNAERQRRFRENRDARLRQLEQDFDRAIREAMEARVLDHGDVLTAFNRLPLASQKWVVEFILFQALPDRIRIDGEHCVADFRVTINDEDYGKIRIDLSTMVDDED